MTAANDVAKSLHEKGNDEFKRGNFVAARDIYTDLLSFARDKALANDRAYLAIILSNRAAVYLKLGFFELAWSDASFALHLDESNLKAAYRLSMVCYEMQNMRLAKATFAKYLPINSFMKENKASPNGASSAPASKPLSTDEMDAMNTLLQHQSVCDELANLPEPNLVEEFLNVVYRDYAWENRKKSTLSLKAIRQELFDKTCNTLCLQLIDGFGRGLVAKRQINRGEVVYETAITCSAVDTKMFERHFNHCFCCGADIAAVCDDRYPVFACSVGREVFCSPTCFAVCQNAFHKGCCPVLFDETRRAKMQKFDELMQAFPPWSRTPPLILRLFACAKHADLHPLELPPLRYLKRIKEAEGVTAADGSIVAPQRHKLPANFVVAYRLICEMLDVCFDPRFDFWVFLTLHRILLVSCIVGQEASRFDCLQPALSMLNHVTADPCAAIEVVHLAAPKRVRIVALKDIGVGEQLTVRYGDGDWVQNSKCLLFRYGVYNDASLAAVHVSPQ